MSKAIRDIFKIGVPLIANEFLDKANGVWIKRKLHPILRSVRIGPYSVQSPTHPRRKLRTLSKWPYLKLGPVAGQA